MVKENFDYDFRAVNITDYELDITLKVDNKIFKNILEGSKENLKKKGVVFKEKEVLNFEVPKSYFNVLKIACNKLVNIVNNIVRDDNIFICDHNIKKAFFKKNLFSDKWKIFITLQGSYVDKRD
jgi:hypothetical protein